MCFASKNWILERELKHTPASMAMMFRYLVAEETFRNMHLDQKLDLGQLKLLASRTKLITVPRDQYLIQNGDIVSSFIIIRDGIFSIDQKTSAGEFHDQGDTKWIVIRRSLWGHNNTPCEWPAPGQPIGRPGSGRLQGVFGGLSYY
jgi:CRP-like cAMP-binding protein